MIKRTNEDSTILNDTNKNEIYLHNQLEAFLKKINYKLLFFIIFLIIEFMIISLKLSNKIEYKRDHYIHTVKNKNWEDFVYNNPKRRNISKHSLNHLKKVFINEKNRPYFEEINKKRTFEDRFPLSKKINCKPHFSNIELIAFLS